MRMGTDQSGCLQRSLGCFLMLVGLLFGSIGLGAVLYGFTGAYSYYYDPPKPSPWWSMLFLVIGVPVWLLAIYLIGGGRAYVSSNVRRNWVIAGVIVSIPILVFFMLLGAIH